MGQGCVQSLRNKSCCENATPDRCITIHPRVLAELGVEGGEERGAI